jgi:RNA polymerase-associated protein RTF1
VSRVYERNANAGADRSQGVTTGRPYAVENEQHKTIVTDQYVVAAHGKAEKEWPYIACSESPFTDVCHGQRFNRNTQTNHLQAEWNRYQIVCGKDGIALPKKPELTQKVDDINKFLNRSWTDEELSEKLHRQNTLRDKFSGAERARLEQEVAEARRHGNTTLADELQERLDSMPAPRLAFSTSLKKVAPTKPSGPSQQDRLAEKNRLNRQLNAKQVREAQIAERRKAREAGGGGGGSGADEDPNSRRAQLRKKFAVRTQDGSGSGAGSGASTPANGTPKLGAEDAVPAHVAKLRQQQEAAANGKGGVPKIHRALTDDDIIGSLDLDIDVEI